MINRYCIRKTILNRTQLFYIDYKNNQNLIKCVDSLFVRLKCTFDEYLKITDYMRIILLLYYGEI